MNKSVILRACFTPREAKHIRGIVKANSGTVSEFIRVCVNAQLAQVGDPEAMEMLTAMFEKGIGKFVEMRVQTEIEKAKRGQK